jgi:hypothetical protein
MGRAGGVKQMATNQYGQVVPNAPQTGWSVTSQQETTDFDDRGRAVIGYRIYFTTAGGQQGSVFVPASRYNTVNVQAQIAPIAAHLDQVAGLTVKP